MSGMVDDEFRAKLKSPRFQVPTWLAAAAFVSAVSALIWSGFTEDPIADWITVGAWLQFLAAALTVERLVSRRLRTYYEKESHG